MTFENVATVAGLLLLIAFGVSIWLGKLDWLIAEDPENEQMRQMSEAARAHWDGGESHVTEIDLDDARVRVHAPRPGITWDAWLDQDESGSWRVVKTKVL